MMIERYKQPELVSDAIKVSIVDGEIVLIGEGVTCCMTPGAARESARRLIGAANSTQRT